MKLEARLMNVRAVQGIFDDLNPDTRGRWAQPATGKWAADRNTREFVLSINLQGGSPEGCSGVENQIMTSLHEYVSYFDPATSDYSDRYQCLPVNWGINTGRKRRFFAECKQVTGA